MLQRLGVKLDVGLVFDGCPEVSNHGVKISSQAVLVYNIFELLKAVLDVVDIGL